MTFKRINLSVAAHERLKKAKLPGDSFSDVILREVPEVGEVCETAGELLDYLKSQTASCDLRYDIPERLTSKVVRWRRCSSH